MDTGEDGLEERKDEKEGKKLKRVPKSLLVKVFSFLPVSALATVGSVCKPCNVPTR